MKRYENRRMRSKILCISFYIACMKRKHFFFLIINNFFRYIPSCTDHHSRMHVCICYEVYGFTVFRRCLLVKKTIQPFGRASSSHSAHLLLTTSLNDPCSLIALSISGWKPNYSSEWTWTPPPSYLPSQSVINH